MKQYSREFTWAVCKSHMEKLLEEHEVRGSTLFFHSAVRRLLTVNRRGTWKFFHFEDMFNAEGMSVLLQLMEKIEPSIDWAADRDEAIASITAQERAEIKMLNAIFDRHR